MSAKKILLLLAVYIMLRVPILLLSITIIACLGLFGLPLDILPIIAPVNFSLFCLSIYIIFLMRPTPLLTLVRRNLKKETRRRTLSYPPPTNQNGWRWILFKERY